MPGQSVKTAPATAAADEWAAGGRAAGGVVSALGPSPDEAAGARAAEADAESWASAGWRTDEEAYELRLRQGDAHKADQRKGMWCAALVRMASEMARRRVTEAGEQAAGERAARAAGVPNTALHVAGQAIGEARIDEAGAPWVERLRPLSRSPS